MSTAFVIPMREKQAADGLLDHALRAGRHSTQDYGVGQLEQPTLAAAPLRGINRKCFNVRFVNGRVVVHHGVVHDQYVEGFSFDIREAVIRLGITMGFQTLVQPGTGLGGGASYRCGNFNGSGACWLTGTRWVTQLPGETEPEASDVPEQIVTYPIIATVRRAVTAAEKAVAVNGHIIIGGTGQDPFFFSPRGN